MQNAVLLNKVSPSITLIPEYAHLLSILETDLCNLPWIMENFVLMRGFIPNGAQQVYGIEFFLVPNIWHNSADAALSAKYNYADGITVCSIPVPDYSRLFVPDILGFIKRLINNECFVVLPLDVSKIKRYQRELPFLHNPLIYGYCEATKELYLSDFLNGDRYDDFVCPYSELVDGFRAYKDCFESKIPLEEHWQGQCINIIKRKSSHHQFDLDFFCSQLIHQITPDKAEQEYRTIERGNMRKVFWGNSAYDEMVNHINSQIELGHICDVKPFHSIYDHKVAMNIRIRYLSQLYNLDSTEYNEVLRLSSDLVQNSFHLRNVVLRNQFKLNVSRQQDYISSLAEIKGCEKEMIERLLNILKSL